MSRGFRSSDHAQTHLAAFEAEEETRFRPSFSQARALQRALEVPSGVTIQRDLRPRFGESCTRLGESREDTMRMFLEQAYCARETATHIRQKVAELPAPQITEALKYSERLDARAAEFEYRWLSLSNSSAMR